MNAHRQAGRPRAVSREMLEEAACELFLEQGYERTSVADITQRAGVSRATFFNYISSKSDLLWISVDDALDAFAEHAGRSLELTTEEEALAQIQRALVEVLGGLVPGAIVLAFTNAETMGVVEELEESAARRQRRVTAIIADHLRRIGAEPLRAEVLGAAYAGAVFAALRAWAESEPGSTPFAEVLQRALGMLGMGKRVAERG